MSIYQHFRQEEHPFIDQVISWRTSVERTYEKRLTDFLDPREQQIISTLVGTNNDDLKLYFYGGGDFTERKRAIIAPFYEEIKDDTFDLNLLQASFNEKFNTITHRDVMGAFLSLGIERKKLGDILIENGLIQMMITADIAPYVTMNLTKIKNTNISLSEKPLSSILVKELNWVESNKVVSSLRLDVVIKEIFSLSRKDASQFIEKKHVKVNFRLVDDPAYQLYEGDLLSVRGKGRGKLISIHGKTKKGRLSVTIATLK